MTYRAKVITGGKVVIPAELRRELGIKDGDSLLFERGENGSLELKTYGQVVKEVQSAFRAMRPAGHSGSVVDELIAERREAAAKEDAELSAWQQGRTNG